MLSGGFLGGKPSTVISVFVWALSCQRCNACYFNKLGSTCMASSYHFHEVEGMPFETQASPPLVRPGLTSLGPPLGLPLGPPLGLYLFLPWALLGLFLLGLILFPVGTWALGSWSLGRGAAIITQQLKNIIQQLKNNPDCS